ncbi:MAG: YqiA/YcfP family alpha/beta fold hydrolase [Deferrisomatales bacterium]
MFLYLHGYDGSPTGRKATELRRLLAPAPVLATAYAPEDPERALPHLERFIREAREGQPEEPCILVGSSLGGLYARHLAHRLRLPCVLINPLVDPRATFLPELLPEARLQALDALRVISPREPAPTLALLDLGDEVLDAHATAEALGEHARLVTYPGGSHTFEHLEVAADEIRGWVEER